MTKSNKKKLYKNQQGVSLLITLFIMIIILAIVLSVSALLYGEIKVLRNISNSMVSFYAADSGIEKVLYYDRQVLPISEDGETLVARGLCSMVNSLNPDGITENTNRCNIEPNGSYDPSIYCNEPDFSPDPPDEGCNPNTCENCTVTFKTTFNQRAYTVEASVNQDFYLHVSSIGKFPASGVGGGSRKVEIKIPLP